MGGLFSGLSKLGLSKIEGMDIFDKEEKSERAVEKEPEEVHVLVENEMIYDKKILITVLGKELDYGILRKTG